MPRHALITGASRGIGAAIARHLETDGWSTVDLSRSSGCDLSDRDYMMRTLWNTRQPDALVYCAGHVNPKPLTEITEADWNYTLEVNLTAAFRCVQWFANRERPGAIVLVASTAALRASPEWAAYSAAKAGLVNLALTAAVELAPQGIRVYCVAPGRCATALRKMLAPDEDPETIMRPTEVAEVVATLLDDTGGVLAGQVIEVARRQ